MAQPSTNKLLPHTFPEGIIQPEWRTTKRRSRWDHVSVFPIPGVPRCLPAGLDPDQVEAFLLRVRLEEIQYALTTKQLGLTTNRERSPSPEPVYDKDGKRVNTRDARAVEHYNKERQRLLEQALSVCPSFKPPGDFSRAALKKTRKIPIPEKEYPDYNFIGLIIGPRGNTQKRLERESGAKISIRGRGSVKEGKIKKGTPQPDDDEALHVLVTGDTDEQVEKAYTLIMPLLTPMDENQNEWKKQQLRELAEINGTLRDRTWMQPLPDYDAHITCAICGDASHPTADCPMKGKGVQATTKTQKMDNEYDSFMKEIGEAPKPIEDKTYKEFMHAISEVSNQPGTMPYMPYGYPGWPPMGMPGMPGMPPMPGMPSAAAPASADASTPGVSPAAPNMMPPYMMPPMGWWGAQPQAAQPGQQPQAPAAGGTPWA